MSNPDNHHARCPAGVNDDAKCICENIEDTVFEAASIISPAELIRRGRAAGIIRTAVAGYAGNANK